MRIAATIALALAARLQLEDRKSEAIVPAKAEQQPGKVIPTRRFKFDNKHNLVRCPIRKS